MKLRILVIVFCFLAGATLAKEDPYAARRSVIFEHIGDDIAIVKNSGTDYVLKMNVNWNFYYLTGIQTEGAYLILNGKSKSATIYRQAQRFRGTSEEIEGIEVKELDDFENDLGRSLFKTKNLWIDFGAMPNLDNPRIRLASIENIKNIGPVIHSMRKIKDEHEMELLGHAISTTAAGLVEVMMAAEPGMNEKDFELILDYKFAKANCENLGFGIQAASGPNSTHVHYGNNDRETQAGDMIVFDVGARSGFYSADISRSFPVSGKFTKEQKEIYSLVLKAQKTAISNMKPGNTIGFASNSAAKVITAGLAELGLITDFESKWQKQLWIQHGFFHHIGLVVHDVGGYNGILEPGMIITMEPGLYFPENYLATVVQRFSRSVDKDELESFIAKVEPIFEKYINIGVRIEDDVYITESGNKIISAEVPKEIDEIEALMKKSSFFNGR